MLLLSLTEEVQAAIACNKEEEEEEGKGGQQQTEAEVSAFQS